ncbi:MAG TPA: hypothetical protein VD788_17230 [Candidatus Polarisedimenticolaceae bacterium]|nr:hypothetical protein [Candidatus Polarisedimenticolaceae bacterium]
MNPAQSEPTELPSPPRRGFRKQGSPQPNHHLWRNGRLWWIAFTVHKDDWTAERVRRSLGTDDLGEARRRRDLILRHYDRAERCRLSLRF